jgi:hypothetical protein
MTLFGKILVVLNLLLGVLLLSWALGVYTQRIDWHSKGGGPDKPMGEIAKRKERVEQLWRALQGAEARWQPAWATAWVPQQQRAKLDQWYKTQLATLDAGQAPVKWPVYKDGRLVIVTDKAESLFVPLLEEGKDRAGQPLRSLEVYKQEIEATQKGIQVELEKLLKAQKEDAELTLKLGGDLESGGKIKGMRHRLHEEKVKQERVEAEVKILSPLLVNSEVEGELLQKRHDQLLRRIAELESLGVAER